MLILWWINLHFGRNFCKRFDFTLELSFRQFFIPKLSLHQYSMPWLYHFTSTPCPDFITSPVCHALTLSLYQRPVPLRYHFINLPHPGIITSPTFHTLVLSLHHTLTLSLHLCSMPWYHLTHHPCPRILTSPKFRKQHYHFINASYPRIITLPYFLTHLLAPHSG